MTGCVRAVPFLCDLLQSLFQPDIAMHHVEAGLTAHHQGRHATDVVLRVERRIDLHTVSHPVVHQVHHRIRGRFHIVVDQSSQGSGDAVLPGLMQHSLQTLFRYRKGDKVHRPFFWLCLV